MLGNDVVDLRDPESRPESFRPRFDERVFLMEERRAIERDRDPMARRWAHWAAKEAAFKLAKQADPDFVFSPGQCRVHFDEPIDAAGQRLERVGRVEWVEAVPKVTSEPPRALETIVVRSFETEDRIHLVALPEGADWEAAQHAVERMGDGEEDASAAVRRLAIREIARGLGVAQHRLSIGSHSPTSPRIPTLEMDGEATDLALSFSHHGRWIAYAMTPAVKESNAILPSRPPESPRAPSDAPVAGSEFVDSKQVEL